MLVAGCRGHGIGHAIACWTMRQVGERWPIDRVLAHVAPDNAPSLRILEVQDFRLLGGCSLPDYPETDVLLRYESTRPGPRSGPAAEEP